MVGCVYSGKLIYVNTDNGKIQIEERDEDGVVGVAPLEFDPEGPRFKSSKWEDLLSCTVECTVIDDKLISIYRTEE